MEEKRKKENEPLNNINNIKTCEEMPQNSVESQIITIRGVQVILDYNLAKHYQVGTKVLNQAVKRNMDRFPSNFMFQLDYEEFAILKSQIVTSSWGGTRRAPFAFTEQGVAMLSAVLHSSTAVEVSIKIMDAFVSMRRFLASNAQVFQRLDRIEYKLLESDHKFEEIYSKLEEKSLNPKQGIFFDGQIYDAHAFVVSLIKEAARRIVLIDNYVDGSVLTLLDNRNTGVEAIIYTMKISPPFQLDIEKHDAQYPPIPVELFTRAHDRFLIIDDKVYHIGASLKDLGKKWFAFSLMEETDAVELMNRLNAET